MILAAWAGVLVLASDLVAQHRPQGSRFLSLDGWAYEAIAGLRNRGFLANLDPLTQPYRRADLAEGLRDLDPGAVPEPLAHWIRLLSEELQPELDRLAGRDSVLWGLQAVVGVTGSSSRRLDPLLPLRDDEPGRLANRTWPYYAVGVWGETDRFAVEMRLFHDLYHEDSRLADPDGRDPGGVVVLNRTDTAYLSADFSRGSLFVGRTRRNWAPIGAAGLMLSGRATSYPHIGFELGRGRLSTRFLLGELDPAGDQDRYVVANALTYQVEDFAIRISEARVYALTNGGPGLRNLAPFELIFFDNSAAPGKMTANLVLDGQIWLRRGGWVWFGEFLLDDIDVIPE
ncbi:MAG: hypothetical protein HY701_02130, partial [Gemmatimonadetes bacterium]|nr:hypothetical protein [Gemmatimonadota bacterium]